MGDRMSYYIAQILGLLVTAGVILTLQLKKKKQMLTVSVIINIMSAVNILLLNGFNSGVVVCFVAVFQLLLSLWHEFKNTDITTASVKSRNMMPSQRFCSTRKALCFWAAPVSRQKAASRISAVWTGFIICSMLIRPKPS